MDSEFFLGTGFGVVTLAFRISGFIFGALIKESHFVREKVRLPTTWLNPKAKPTS